MVAVWTLVLGLPAIGRAQSDSPPPLRGSETDPILEIVEFSDFECPYCAGARPVLDSLLTTHAAAVRLVFRHYPLPAHPHAQRAAEAAVEADRQGAFWAYADLLFAHRERLTATDLVGYADSLGLDGGAFARALREGTHAAVVQRDVRLGRSLAVSGTPTFFVNGFRLVGTPPLWVFEEALRAFGEKRVQARPAPAGDPGPSGRPG